MSKYSLAVPLMLCAVLLSIGSTAVGQATPVGIPGLITNKLPPPGQPGTPSPVNCPGGGTPYTYEVAALDFVGGSTAVGSMSSTITNGCTPSGLSQTAYITVATPAVAGAATCNVFRSTANPPTSTSFSGVGNVPCGATFYDTAGTPTNPPLLPLADTSGGIQSVGMVAAQAFSAGGNGAGTEILNSGMPLGSCPNSTGPFISCIPSMNAFFEQAPSSITSNSWGITWPSAPTSITIAPTSPLIGPFLFGAVVTTPPTNASPVTIGALTNQLNYILATASTSVRAFTNGDIITVSGASPNVDFVDSGIATPSTSNPLKGTVLAEGSSPPASFSATPTLGSTGGATGTLGLAGTTSGTVTIQPAAAAGSYNFNLPTSAGTSGQPLLSGGGLTGSMSFGTLSVGGGGTGQTTLTTHGVLVGDGASAITQLGAAAAGTLLAGQGTTSDPSFSATPTLGSVGTTGTLGLAGTTSGTVTIQPAAAAGSYNFNLPTSAGTSGQPLLSGGGLTGSMSFGTLSVGGGGTGQTTLTTHGVLVGDGASAITQLGAAAAGTLLAGQGTTSDPSFSATPTLGSVGTTGTLGLAGTTSGTVTIRPAAAAGSYNFNLPTSAGTSGQPLLSGGGSLGPMSFGTLSVGGGGTGQTTLTTHGVLVGDGASAITQLGAAAAGTLLAGQGTTSDPSFSATPTLGSVGTTGTLGLAGTTSGTVTIQPAAAAGSYNFNLPTSAGTTGQPLLSGGGMTGSMTFGTLGLAAGGTNSANGAVTSLCAGASGVTPGTSGLFMGFGISVVGSANESKVNLPVPVSGTVTAMHVVAGTVPASNVTITFHARYGNANFTTDLSCSISTTSACDATGGTQSISEGVPNTWDIEAISSGTGTPVAQNFGICLKVVGAN